MAKEMHNGLEEVSDIYEEKLRKYVKQQRSIDQLYVNRNISIYSDDVLEDKDNYRELFAEAIVKMDNKQLADDNLRKIIEEMIDYDANDR